MAGALAGVQPTLTEMVHSEDKMAKDDEKNRDKDQPDDTARIAVGDMPIGVRNRPTLPGPIAGGGSIADIPLNASNRLGYPVAAPTSLGMTGPSNFGVSSPPIVPGPGTIANTQVPSKLKTAGREFGKIIGNIGRDVGSSVGQVLIPWAMPAIPGTIQHESATVARQRSAQQFQTEQEKEKAQTEEQRGTAQWREAAAQQAKFMTPDARLDFAKTQNWDQQDPAVREWIANGTMPTRANPAEREPKVIETEQGYATVEPGKEGLTVKPLMGPSQTMPAIGNPGEPGYVGPAPMAPQQIRPPTKKAETQRFEPKEVAGPDGKPMFANYDPSTGKYFDAQGREIAGAQPFVKPTEDVGKMGPEIEAQIGPPPTTATFQGKAYPSPAEARAAWGKAAEVIKNREAAAGAMARGEAYGEFRPVNVYDPNTQTMRVEFAKNAIAEGAAPAAQAGQIMSKQAQFGEMHVAAQKARAAIQGLDKDFTPAQIGKLTLAMRQDDPGVFKNEIETMLGTQQLTPAQQDFVVWISQLNERAMALRNVAGMGQGSQDLRSAIRATLPGVKSGSKEMALKQLGAFENQVSLLEKGVPGVKGSKATAGAVPTGGAAAPAAGVISPEEWLRQKRGQ